MLLSRVRGAWKVITDSYTLTFVRDRPFVYLEDIKGKRLAELFVLSGVHPLHDRDDCTRSGPWRVQESPDVITFSMDTESSVWKRKTYRFRCQPGRFVYEVEVEGQGKLSEVDYFGGYSSAHLRWGSGHFWSGQNFLTGFTYAPNAEEENSFAPAEGSGIELMGVPLPGKSHWFFTPPPFCFGFQGANNWLGLGVEVRPGENRFTEYRYHGGKGCFHLTLSFEGHTRVNGCYSPPSIGFDFAKDAYSVLEAHVTALRNAELVPVPQEQDKPDWWYEPIFCGWGAQSYLAEIEKGKAPRYSRQTLYEGFLKTLEENEIDPGIVVLDDKWQATYGENQSDERKWPDLRGFVDQQHTRGRKVLLWLKAWDPEGVPPEECIRNASGYSLAVDPSNPAYQERLRASVRRMLSNEGYDADGFKIDFTARIPSGPGIHVHGDLWGLELMRLYLEIIYTEAKRTKPEALVMAHAPHPYLADVLDMVRLNDMNKYKDILSAMALRARVARIACPDAIIDTDNWPVTDLATWRAYTRLQPELGVPSLYYVSHIDTTGEPLQAKDYQLIRDIWARHRARESQTYPRRPLKKTGRPFSMKEYWRSIWSRKRPTLKSAW